MGSVTEPGTTPEWAMAVQGVSGAIPVDVNIVGGTIIGGGGSGNGTVALVNGTVVGITTGSEIGLVDGTSVIVTNTSSSPLFTSIVGTASVSGSVTVVGTALVAIDSMPSISGSVSITGTPTVTWTGAPNVSIYGTPSVTGTVAISNHPSVTILSAGQELSAQSLSVVIASDQTVPVSIAGTSSITGAVSVTGTSSITGAVSITGTPSVSISGTPTITGAVSITGTPAVTATITGTPAVTATITGTPAVNATIVGTPAVTASITGTPTVTGSVAITGTPNVAVTNTPNVSITGTPTVTGAVTVTNSPTVSVSGTLPVTGSVAITGTPNVAITGTPSVSITGTPSITGAVSVSSMPSITGAVSITGTPAVSISGTPAVSVSGTATVAGAVSITGTSAVTISNSPTVTLSSVGQNTSANSIPVVLASDQSSIAVDASITGTPTVNVAPTGQNIMDASISVALASDQSTIPTSIVGTPAITGVVSITGNPVVSITGTPTVTLSGTETVSISNAGQMLSVGSIPVVLASDQSSIPVSASITGTPTVTGNVTISNSPTVSVSGTAMVAGTVSLSSVGQSLSAGSIPVVLASDQSAVPVSVTNVGQTLSASSIPVVLASDQSTVSVISPDCVSIFNGVINSLATTAVFDTTGFNIVVIQVTGQWFGNMYVEISNDGTNFFKKPILNDSEKLITDNISANGIYFFRPSSRYFWINPELFNGSANVIVYGRSVNGPDVGDALNLALDQTNNVQLNVAMKNVAQDTANRLIPSDAPQMLLTAFNGTTVSPFYVVDTSGYQSIAVQLFGTWAGTISFYTSNDTSTQDQIAVAGYSAGGSQTPITTATANGVYQFPCVGRFFIIKMTSYTSGNCQVSAYLRQQPISISFLSTPSVNTSQIGGSGVVNAGVAGMAAVGGNIAVGSAQTANPIVAGAVDTAALTRRILSDATGRLGLSGLDQTNIQRAMNLLTAAASYENVAQLPVNDIGQTEGHNTTELLMLILTEMKILNQQLFQLPLVLNNLLQFNTPTAIDEPDQMRNDPTLFSTNT